jgi:hypothetical protein
VLRTRLAFVEESAPGDGVSRVLGGRFWRYRLSWS